MKRSVAIIGTNGIPARYGGFETLAEHLALHLRADYDVAVYCSKTARSERTADHHGARLIYLPFKANGWQSIVYDAVSIVHALFTVDVLVVLGFSGFVAFPLRAILRKRVLFNLGGIEWQKVTGATRLAGIERKVKQFIERVCVSFSDIVVVDNAVLQDYVTREYAVPSFVAEYGGDHAVPSSLTPEHRDKHPFASEPYDFAMSRAQRDLNLHLLIDAYAGMPERNVVIVSNWSSSAYGAELWSEHADRYPNVFLREAIYDLAELNALRSNARLYLHAHTLCGTAPSLTEAMSLGLPVVSIDVPTNRSTTEERAVYFTDAASLRTAVRRLTPSRLLELSVAMQEIARRRYTWSRVAGIYSTCRG
jgi:glycosyltransferase involved in cell wall biosynthesis